MTICPHCNQPIKIGQAELTEAEKRKVDWAGPPENGRPNIIEAQRIKALAQYYGIEDWMTHWDETLSPEENAEIFRRKSTNPEVEGPTMKELRGREVIRQGGYEDRRERMEY